MVVPASETLIRVHTATLQGSGATNQDAVVVTDRAVAVLDGSTSWIPAEPGRDGGWYSHELALRLSEHLDDPHRSLIEVMAEAIREMHDSYGLTPGVSPESTVTIARWDAERLELLLLCDSPAIVFLTSGDFVELHDRRLEHVSAEARAHYHELLATGAGYGSAVKATLAEIQQDERRHRNRPGGYWIAEATPEAAAQAITRSFPLEEVAAVLLLTDGASAAVHDYTQPPTWPDALAAIERDGPDAFLATVHALEKTDPDGQHWPRSKPHDDKTVALLRRDGLRRG